MKKEKVPYYIAFVVAILFFLYGLFSALMH